jgi:cell division septal protein FtsQ
VSGNSSVSKEDILSIVDLKLNERYLGFIRTDNLFLIKNSEIKNQILDEFKKIESVRVGFHSLTSIEVIVSERTPADIWCKGNPINTGQCFFIDKNGYVYGEAPKFSANPYPLYFGLLNGNPIGQSYFDKKKFTDISKLFNKLTDMNFSPVYFIALDIHQYEIGLSGGGKIKIADNQPYDKSITNLQALIDSKYIKTDQVSLGKINYIDLRFDNKVPFDIRK